MERVEQPDTRIKCL